MDLNDYEFYIHGVLRRKLCETGKLISVAIKRILLVSIIIQFTYTFAFSQAVNNPIRRNGYIIYNDVHGHFFQPCDTPSMEGFWKCLGKNSFRLIEKNHSSNNSLSDLTKDWFANRDTLLYQVEMDSSDYVGVFYSKYVELTFVNSHRQVTQNLWPCILMVASIRAPVVFYPLFCFSFDAVILNIR